MMVGYLEPSILKELDYFVKSVRKIKDHRLGFIRNHKNAGNNSYQMSVPSGLLENSFSMAYFNHLGNYYLSRVSGEPFSYMDRRARFRENRGHYDGYDFWVNFSNKGDENPPHSHAGLISSVLYIKNDGLATDFENGVSFTGKRGQILVFPSSLMHAVREKKTRSERITMSFNMVDADQGEGVRP